MDIGHITPLLAKPNVPVPAVKLPMQPVAQ
jgi:hypothetical protein